MGNGEQSSENIKRYFNDNGRSCFRTLTRIITICFYVGVIYDMFKRDQDYYSILKNAVDFGYELWHSDKQKMIVVSVEGHEQTRAFLAEMQQKQS